MFFLLYEFCFWYPYPEKASYFHFDCKFSSAEGYLISAVNCFQDKFKESERLGWVTMTASSSTMENASHMVCTFFLLKRLISQSMDPQYYIYLFSMGFKISILSMRKSVHHMCRNNSSINILFLCFFGFFVCFGHTVQHS